MIPINYATKIENRCTRCTASCDHQGNRTWEIFLDRLGKLIHDTQTDCFAWALLPNHVHLLLRTGLIPVSVLMSRLLTGYTVWFNKKYRRHGLFQNRYKSILCQEDPY